VAVLTAEEGGLVLQPGAPVSPAPGPQPWQPGLCGLEEASERGLVWPGLPLPLGSGAPSWDPRLCAQTRQDGEVAGRGGPRGGANNPPPCHTPASSGGWWSRLRGWCCSLVPRCLAGAAPAPDALGDVGVSRRKGREPRPPAPLPGPPRTAVGSFTPQTASRARPDALWTWGRPRTRPQPHLPFHLNFAWRQATLPLV